MSYANEATADYFQETPVAYADEAVRAEFVRKTYVNLALAVAAFAALTAILLQIPLTQRFCERMLQSPIMFLFSLIGVMIVGWIAERWAANSPSVEIQYAGLALYTVGEAVFFLPILYMAQHYVHPDVIPTAGVITLAVFGGLTASVFLTRKDFSFLGPALSIAGMAAIGLIVCSFLFGFSLGILFSVAMVVLAAGYILYYTSNVLHHYPVGMHVAAALALFSALALLFWYVLRIVMSLYLEE
jgi:FtsH-binding integral membrane protein